MWYWIRIFSCALGLTVTLPSILCAQDMLLEIKLTGIDSISVKRGIFHNDSFVWESDGAYDTLKNTLQANTQGRLIQAGFKVCEDAYNWLDIAIRIQDLDQGDHHQDIAYSITLALYRHVQIPGGDMPHMR